MKKIILTIALFTSFKAFSQKQEQFKVGDTFVSIYPDRSKKLKLDTVTVVQETKSIVYFQNTRKKDFVMYTKKKYFLEEYKAIDSLRSK